MPNPEFMLFLQVGGETVPTSLQAGDRIDFRLKTGTIGFTRPSAADERIRNPFGDDRFAFRCDSADDAQNLCRIICALTGLMRKVLRQDADMIVYEFTEP